jgi:hypothetical protein
MGSHSIDSSTQSAASTGAQQQDAQLAANAAQNQTFANNARSTLFGTYNPSTNQYTGGSYSQYLNPSSTDTNTLSGAYSNLYRTQADQTAQGAKQAVTTSLQNAASHGMGATPSGYTADQERQAYQDQANQNSTNYATDFGNQHAEDVKNFNTATAALNSNSTGASTNSIQGNSAAAGNYSGLYGTASQQTQSPWNAVLGAGAAVGGAAVTKYCWIAAELFGGWLDPRTMLVREWLENEFCLQPEGRKLLRLYTRFGARMAEKIRTNGFLRAQFAGVFELALEQATAWKGAQ